MAKLKLFKADSKIKLNEVDLFKLAATTTVPSLIETKGVTLKEEELITATRNVYNALKKAADDL